MANILLYANNLEPSNCKDLILISGYAIDSQCYLANIDSDLKQAPAAKLLREAVSFMDQEKIAIRLICHSLWLFSADLVLRKGRNVTCAHNIICDVKNANANILTSSNQNVDAHKD